MEVFDYVTGAIALALTIAFLVGMGVLWFKRGELGNEEQIVCQECNKQIARSQIARE